MQNLTTRQKNIFDYIVNHQKASGYWPSIRDIQARFGLVSTNGVVGHLRALEAKGVIQRVPGAARAYRILGGQKQNGTDDGKGGNSSKNGTARHAPPAGEIIAWEDAVDIPVYGSIAAGYPDGVESAGVVAHLKMNLETAGVRRKNGVFALRVRGESMINAGIFDGDTVILEKGEPRDGDIVAALIDGQTTLKRFVHRSNKQAFLRAENPAFPDLIPATELFIQGIARSIVRSLA